MKLTKSIKAHGEELTEITMRKPTGEEIMELGFPFSVADGDVTPKAKVVGRYIVKLAAIPLSSVGQISPEDFMSATAEVIGFFGASAEEETPEAPKT